MQHIYIVDIKMAIPIVHKYIMHLIIDAIIFVSYIILLIMHAPHFISVNYNLGPTSGNRRKTACSYAVAPGCLTKYNYAL